MQGRKELKINAAKNTGILIDHLIGILIFGIVFMATNWDSIVNSMFLWPIELLILVLTQRRIGDLLARTQVTNIRVGGNKLGI